MARASITKDQQKELVTTLKKLKVPQASIDTLISSTHGSNTYKAFRQGKKIPSIDGKWIINFGSKWAKPTEEALLARPADQRAVQQSKVQMQQKPNSTLEIPTIDESMVPDSPPIEIDMPDLGSGQDGTAKAPAQAKSQNLIMVSFQLEKEYLLEMQKIAAKQGININMLSRLAIKRFLGK